jgi:hypothetical protein
MNPASKDKLAEGQTINEYSYEVELQHGRNIATAASTIPTTLSLFIFSSLSAAKKLSHGKYTWVYHFDSKAAIVEHIERDYPELASKMSCVQIGFYADNWKKLGMSAPRKTTNENGDVVFEIVNGCRGSSLYPWVDTVKDTGKFVKGLVEAGPGKTVLGVSEMVSYNKYMAIWGEINGVRARHRQVSMEEWNERLGALAEETRKEVTESYLYVEEFGWDGGEEGVLRPSDVSLNCSTSA